MLPSSTAIVVLPTALVVDVVATSAVDISSKAVALGQIDTCKLFPCVPAVLAANVPTIP